MSQLRPYPDAHTAAVGCGEQILQFLEVARRSKHGKEPVTLAISGGSSPKPLFSFFATTPFDWSDIHIFWVDERHVPIDDPQSNYRFANALWLKPAAVPESNIHRVPVELPPSDAALEYALMIRQVFDLPNDQLPRFDVIHLGMGPDGHTASLFPGQPLIADRSGLTAAVWAEKFRQWRITLLPGVLLAARHICVLAPGDEKASVLSRLFSSPDAPAADPMQIPAQLATGPECLWFVDQAAMGKLPNKP